LPPTSSRLIGSVLDIGIHPSSQIIDQYVMDLFDSPCFASLLLQKRLSLHLSEISEYIANIHNVSIFKKLFLLSAYFYSHTTKRLAIFPFIFPVRHIRPLSIAVKMFYIMYFLNISPPLSVKRAYTGSKEP
jgi:hypothetical protein